MAVGKYTKQELAKDLNIARSTLDKTLKELNLMHIKVNSKTYETIKAKVQSKSLLKNKEDEILAITNTNFIPLANLKELTDDAMYENLINTYNSNLEQIKLLSNILSAKQKLETSEEVKVDTKIRDNILKFQNQNIKITEVLIKIKPLEEDEQPKSNAELLQEMLKNG